MCHLTAASFFEYPRNTAIRRMLAPLARNIDRVDVRMTKDFATGGQIITAHDYFTSTKNPRERSFKSTVEDVLCQYYEVWLPSADEAEWSITAVCLHLCERGDRRGSMRELVCLHTEPNLSVDEHRTRVRASPHLHIKVRTGRLERISGSHLPLNYGHLDDVLESVDALQRALEDGVKIVIEEIVARL